MNNIYVDELPKDCGYCCYCFGCEEDGYYCDLDVFHREYDFDGRHPNCPLKSLKDALAEERKKVCEQIYQLFTNGRMWSTMKDWWLNNGTCIELKQVLDAVETETPNQEIIKKFSKDREYYALLENLREQHFLALNKNELDQIERGEL